MQPAPDSLPSTRSIQDTQPAPDSEERSKVNDVKMEEEVGQSARAIRKAQRESKVYEEARNGSALLAVSSKRARGEANAPKTVKTSTDDRASKRQRSDSSEGEDLTKKETRPTEIEVADAQCQEVDGMVTEHDDVTTDASDSIVSLETKFSYAELENLLAIANTAVAELQTKMDAMGRLLRRQERQCHEKDKLISELNGKVVVLEQNQYATGSVAQKILLKLQGKV